MRLSCLRSFFLHSPVIAAEPAHRLIVGWDDAVIVCGPGTNYHTPPPHADGWRLDGWNDLWTYNMAERWEQWQRDVAEFGHIKFIEQSFDVSLRWTPTPNFVVDRSAIKRPDRGAISDILLQDGFEELNRDRWSLREGQATDITIDNDVAYGHELQSLRMRGAGGRVQLTAPVLTWQPDGLLLVDADIFLRCELPYVQITPGPNVTSSDEVALSLVMTTDSKPLIELRTHQGTWHHRAEDKLTDTKLPAACDAWNHLQLVIDPQTKTCRVILQVVGEAPRELCRTSLNHIPATDAPLAVKLFCHRSKPQADGPAFDNLRVTRGVRAAIE